MAWQCAAAGDTADGGGVFSRGTAEAELLQREPASGGGLQLRGGAQLAESGARGSMEAGAAEGARSRQRNGAPRRGGYSPVRTPFQHLA